MPRGVPKPKRLRITRPRLKAAVTPVQRHSRPRFATVKLVAGPVRPAAQAPLVGAQSGCLLFTRGGRTAGARVIARTLRRALAPAHGAPA